MSRLTSPTGERKTTESISKRLEKNIPKIMNAWTQRAYREVKAAHNQNELALKNSLTDYLRLLVDALSKTIIRTNQRKEADKIKSTLVGQKHGTDRAGKKNYTIEQLISEYHILRQVICEELEREAPLNSLEREVIVGSIEQAVNDAASEFSYTMRRLQQQITYSLAHDLRTPITVAKTASELILHRPHDTDSHLKKAMQISTSMDRVDRMISDLLDVSRIEAGEGVALHFIKSDLDKIIREVAEEFEETFEGNIVVQSAERCNGYWYDEGLRRVFENLISNAIKYGHKKSPVSISLTQDEYSATITVHNDGAAIPEEEIKTLFQHFKRAKSAENKVGWGLGLTMVQSMVEAHGGNVSVVSNADSGTSFIISLPKGEDEKSQSEAYPHKSIGPRDATVNY